MHAQAYFEPTCERATQLEGLLSSAIPELVRFVNHAEQERSQHGSSRSLISDNDHQISLVNPLSKSRESLESTLRSNGFLAVDEEGSGAQGIQRLIESLLKFSVNPSAPGFLDKLYAAPLPPGIAAELILGVLNTNLHVYQVSPVLTLVEKHVARALANMFGLNGPRSGGISVQGGSASNMTSIVVARNTLFPETKVEGNSAVKGQLLLFTSAHGHYSIEKAAQALGFGSSSVIPVPVDTSGRMLVSELERLVIEAKRQGKVPFYVNATAGTTVLGSFDRFEDIHKVAKEHKLWFHVDAAWGGGFVFSADSELRRTLQRVDLADSVATNPHKMLGVPVTCSFLLAKDLQTFQKANTLKAEYLFHDDNDETAQRRDLANDNAPGSDDEAPEDDWSEPYDLADLTLQCGRRGDALKFFFCWKYYGTSGYSSMVDAAYQNACHLATLVAKTSDLTPVLSEGSAPGCLQVCFYFTPGGKFTYGLLEEPGRIAVRTSRSEQTAERTQMVRIGKFNSQVTSSIAKALVPRGFMIDFAPALEGQEDQGSFFRVVVNISTVRKTLERLLQELVSVGTSVVANIPVDAGRVRF
ncbi:Glutamate decarboxylase 2 [Exophiala xenobiotica]|uniref:Glutamate decarboxylase 2 n=1 Tax=Lithohypha guttulata TaxID=1690604 RepID=A0ABR0K9T6_9EURO|nr:Glutamate decarboxylase 2 [Lithohypha guttulata]KAK5326895.1 Glutamate decarboxylase 2 [Exophiala xenobiotica]